MAAASGSLDIVSLLLSYSALPFLSTLLNDSLCYSGAAQKVRSNQPGPTGGYRGQAFPSTRLTGRPGALSGQRYRELSGADALFTGHHYLQAGMVYQVLTVEKTACVSIRFALS